MKPATPAFSSLLLPCAIVLALMVSAVPPTRSVPLHRSIGHSAARRSRRTQVAAVPPMGWNSWDSYGESATEKDIRANADVMARRLKSFGWQYVVVDMGWYVTNHSAGADSKSAKFSMDRFGRYTPAVNSFPSAKNGRGLRPLADYVHSRGLKFGLHIIRGIPRMAVKENLPIAGSPFHAAEAASTPDTCPWNSYNYGVHSSNPAAQAYYDSILRLYASWGVDFLKVDCIASHPYRGADIRMLAEAIHKAGRPIVLSLSPGPAPLDKAAEFQQYAQMWRISDDVWDVWHSSTNFPQGPGNQFVRAAEWEKDSGPGHWPDADMLPLGKLEPSPGWESPRTTRLTRDEQRTLITLWAMFHSPLIMGGNLTLLDGWTASLLTNSAVIAVDQQSRDNRAVVNTNEAAVWLARPESGDDYYLAVFNLENAPQKLAYWWKDLGLTRSHYNLRDLWKGKNLGAAASLSLTLAPHSSVLYRLSPR